MNTRRRLLVGVVCLALLVTPVLAHEPAFSGENTRPERAYRIDDPAKSWAVYDTLARDQVRYYEVDLDAGDRLRVSLYTPDSDSFTPSLVLMHRGFENATPAPSWVTVPDGYGAQVVEGERPGETEYEPFTPGSYYYTVDVDRTVDRGGTYLLAVYDPERRAGAMGMAVGYEERFSAVGYLTIPFQLLSIHVWEGQHPLFVVAPLLLVVVGGIVALRRRFDRSTAASLRGLLAAAALLFVGTAAITAVQTVLALSKSGPTASALLTAAFVVVPATAGAWLWRRSVRGGDLRTPATRLGLVLVGVAGFVTWAGLLVAPVMVLLAAVLPDRLLSWLAREREKHLPA